MVLRITMLFGTTLEKTADFVVTFEAITFMISKFQILTLYFGYVAIVFDLIFFYVRAK